MKSTKDMINLISNNPLNVLDEIDKLVKAGVDPNAYGQASLNLAINSRNDSVALHLARFYCIPAVEDSVILAIDLERMTVVKAMLSAGAVISDRVLEALIMAGAVDIVEYLFKSFRVNEDRIFNTAILNNSVEIARLSIKMGVVPCYVDGLFIGAVRKGCGETVRYLVKNFDIKSDCMSEALFIASENCCASIVSTLLNAGATLRHANILDAPVSNGNDQIVRKLIKAGANPWHISKDSFIEACREGFIATIRQIALYFNADIVEEAIRKASLNGEVETVRYLVSSITYTPKKKKR